MQKGKLIKISIFNVCLVLVNILCFSDKALRFSISHENTFISALSLTMIIMSVVSFFYVNYKLLNSKTEEEEKRIEEIVELIKILNNNRYKHSLEPIINQTIQQIESMSRKKCTLDDLLILKFKVIDEDLNGFKDVIDDTNDLMFRNVKRIISIITIFDQIEYSSYNKRTMPTGKQAIYNENQETLRLVLEKNDEILISIDKLLIEISKIGDMEEKDEINLQRISDIISNMKKLRTSEY